MSWVSSLCALYDANAWRAGEVEVWNRGKRSFPLMLLPVSHTTVRAKIEVVLHKDGYFLSARALGKEDSSETIAPTTEEAMSRTSTAVYPYPLFDGLKYVAGDFLEHVQIEGDSQKKTDDMRNHIKECFPKYIDSLEKWCVSDFAHPKICSIYRYLSQKTLVADLIAEDVITVDEFGFASGKQKIGTDELAKATVRFCVKTDDECSSSEILADTENIYSSAVWLDKTVQRSFIDYYASLSSKKDLCYLSGKVTRTSSLHPKKIRYDGDGTKLFSANDDSNFTYRGRFWTKGDGFNEAMSIGYEASQKMHNALKWIIRRQGYTTDGVCMATWENALNDLPAFYDSAFDIINGTVEADEDTTQPEDTAFIEEERDTATNYLSASEFNAALDGYATGLNDSSNMVILALDNATPGRLALIYYKELDSSRYLENIRIWQESCCWKQEYFRDKKLNYYEGMVSIPEIAAAVYGTEQGSGKRLTLRKNSDGKRPMLIFSFERLRPCIIDSAAIPRDMVHAAVLKASNPLAYKSDFNYNRVLHVACSLVKRLYWEKYLKDESGGMIYTMELDQNNRERSYLYGRMLAVAEKVERMTYEKGETRTTNAERYMQSFSRAPFRTWTIIWRSLQPYMKQLKPGTREFYKNLLGEITGLFQYDDRTSDAPLDGRYLLGYDCQRTAMKKDVKVDEKPDTETKIIN